MSAEAADLILQYYQSAGLGVESKSDDSPVTIADRKAELLMRERIGASFPDDGILGEEFDGVPSKNGFRWILDPIDGTKPFIHGVPLFGTLIGVEYQDRVVIGVCRFPALSEVVYAADGSGAWWQIGDQPVRKCEVRACSQLESARMMFTEPTSWRPVNRVDVMNRLMSRVRIARGWGDCYGHIMVATGRAELMVDPLMSAWDIAALIPILKEAGGCCVDWQGNEDIQGGEGVSVVPGIRDEVLQILGAEPRLRRA
ncbi:MAG: histidinol-phosphatase [Planctomycetaceae bacterium]|nr:histidinol-phosphatase [Planctomycetaceae bacterium]